ncbi:MAG: T9SS type A sorting domain-containing protein [Saprospiraceae bacterium]
MLHWETPLTAQQSLKLFNLQGQLLKTDILAQGTNRFELDMAAMPAGVYLLQVGESALKIIKAAQ